MKTKKMVKENAIFKIKPRYAESTILISEDEKVIVVTNSTAVECKTGDDILKAIKAERGNIGWFATDKGNEMSKIDEVINELYAKDYIN